MGIALSETAWPSLVLLFFLMKRFLFSLLLLCPFQTQAATLQCGYASFYGTEGYHGQRTASGEIFNAYGPTAAHKSLPFGTRVRVTDQASGKSTIVKINDDGPHVPDRIIDLSYGAFARIAPPSRGVTKVCISKL
jgi:rare lipoprotein A